LKISRIAAQGIKENEMAQTEQEIERIIAEWVRDRMPQTGLLDLRFNGTLLASWLIQQKLPYSIGNLDLAYRELGDAATGGLLIHKPEVIVRTKTLKEIERERLDFIKREAEEDKKKRSDADAATAERKDDVNDEHFKRRQAVAKIKFEHITDGYMKVNASGRVNHSLTQDRKAGLRGIRVVSNTKDKDGKTVLLYDKMLELVAECFRGFDREDARSNS
jgi:hypothetical protein